MVTLLTVIGITTAVSMALDAQSQRAAAYRRRVAAALDRAGIKHGAAARDIGVSEKHFSDFLRGLRPMSAHRLADLPDEFHHEFDRLGVEARGGLVVMAPHLMRLVEGVDRLLMAHEPPADGSAFDRMLNPVNHVHPKAQVS
jgi:hypothetical protein